MEPNLEDLGTSLVRKQVPKIEGQVQQIANQVGH